MPSLADIMKSSEYRNRYPQDWSVSVDRDYLDLHDHHGNIVNRTARGAPKVEMEFRGKPVTVTDDRNGNKRIAIWMPGEQMRTRPLLEEQFLPDDFYEAAKNSLQHVSMNSPMFGSQGPLGLTEAFCIWWAEKNYGAILAEEDRRERDGIGWSDLGQWSRPDDPVEYDTFRGEDGRTYAKLKPNKAAELRRLQSELEELPGFGSF